MWSGPTNPDNHEYGPVKYRVPPEKPDCSRGPIPPFNSNSQVGMQSSVPHPPLPLAPLQGQDASSTLVADTMSSPSEKSRLATLREPMGREEFEM
eukprot:11159364-Prorocentrum_lima.AAC.1